MTQLLGRRAWIVGASSGIGAAVAQHLVQRGCRVAISARNRAGLDRVASGRMLCVPVDFTDAAAVVAAAEAVRAELGGLDLVVIAAGHWERMEATSFDNAAFARHITTNVLGMGNVIAAVLPDMLEQRSGTIAGISSVAGYRGMPGAQGYGASKAAQLNLLESLRAGLAGSGVVVQTVAPGFVETPMTSANTFPMPFIISADRAAGYIVRGLEREQAEIVFPPAMAASMKLARFVPQRLWVWLMRPRNAGNA